ncbi:MAG: class II fructose-bisphosphate aldolase [Erysipelotrichaceae bacterium]|nr:class II fructose-bisphosphate aldolase [Erysipelotrichaceae bacterium]
MIVTLDRLLDIANAENKAIGSFNVTGLEQIRACLEAAEEENEPIILAFAQVHEEEGTIDLDTLGPIMVLMADLSPLPICVHLDHCVDMGYLKKALDMGFSSVMFDGSALPLEENVAYTKMAVELAHSYGATIEGEIGVMSGHTLNNDGVVEDREQDENMYTDPVVARDFVRETGIDCLACSFGTVHGLYATEPKLNFELLAKLNETLGVPVVMHGGSGVSEEDFHKCIDNGVRKINYYTYMAKAGAEAATSYKNDGKVLFQDVAYAAQLAMKADAKQAIKIFKNK